MDRVMVSEEAGITGRQAAVMGRVPMVRERMNREKHLANPGAGTTPTLLPDRRHGTPKATSGTALEIPLAAAIQGTAFGRRLKRMIAAGPRPCPPGRKRMPAPAATGIPATECRRMPPDLAIATPVRNGHSAAGRPTRRAEGSHSVLTQASGRTNSTEAGSSPRPLPGRSAPAAFICLAAGAARADRTHLFALQRLQKALEAENTQAAVAAGITGEDTTGSEPGGA